MKLSSVMVAKLRRLIPIMASPHDGEVIATRNAIERALAAGQCDWHDLAAAIVGQAESARSTVPMPGITPSFGDLARACRDLDCGRLEPRERAFVADMVRRGFGFRPSPQQADWLDAIFKKDEREGCGMTAMIAITTPRDAHRAMVTAGAIFAVRRRDDVLGLSFTYKIAAGGDPQRCREILAAVKSRPPVFYQAFLAAVQDAIAASGRGAA